MKRLAAFVCAVMLVGVGMAGTASAAPGDPVLQRFTVVLAKQFGFVITNGSQPSGFGRATATTPTKIDLTFAGGPGSITLTPMTLSPPSPIPACVATTKQAGTFSFEYFPTAMPGFRFGGSGDYTLITTFTPPNAPRKCRKLSLLLNQVTVINAGATSLFAVG